MSDKRIIVQVTVVDDDTGIVETVRIKDIVADYPWEVSQLFEQIAINTNVLCGISDRD